jgi:hypothetical protein
MGMSSFVIGVNVAHAAAQYPDPDLVGARITQFAVHRLEIAGNSDQPPGPHDLVAQHQVPGMVSIGKPNISQDWWLTQSG